MVLAPQYNSADGSPMYSPVNGRPALRCHCGPCPCYDYCNEAPITETFRVTVDDAGGWPQCTCGGHTCSGDSREYILQDQTYIDVTYDSGCLWTGWMGGGGHNWQAYADLEFGDWGDECLIGDPPMGSSPCWRLHVYMDDLARWGRTPPFGLSLWDSWAYLQEGSFDCEGTSNFSAITEVQVWCYHHNAWPPPDCACCWYEGLDCPGGCDPCNDAWSYTDGFTVEPAP